MSERTVLAGEYALRLLEGEELLAARRLIAEDPDFAREVAWWEDRLGTLAEEIAERPLPPGLWARIEAALGRTADPHLLGELRRRVRRWQAAAGLAGAAAVAASAALLLLPRTPSPEQPPTVAEQPRAAPVLVAVVATEQAGSLGVTYLSDQRELVVAPAGLELPPGRSRQLWLIPAGGTPLSLGLVDPAGSERRRLDPALAAAFAAGATIAVSDEPVGGSPTGQPTGAVLGTGALQVG